MGFKHLSVFLQMHKKKFHCELDLRWLCFNYHSVKRINRLINYHHTQSQRDARNTIRERVVQCHADCLETYWSTITSTLFSFNILFFSVWNIQSCVLCNSNNIQQEVTTQLQQTESKLSNVFIIKITCIYQTVVNLALLQFFLFLPDHEKYTFLAPVVGVQETNHVHISNIQTITGRNYRSSHSGLISYFGWFIFIAQSGASFQQLS